MACEDLFIQQLRERGLRVTPQRELVLRVLHEIQGFATAEELCTRVQAIAASIDTSTVYRTLDLLAEFNLVSVLDTGEGQRRYELLGVHGLHHHLHCTRCNRVIGVAHAEFQPLLAQLQAHYGFTVTPSSWTFTGLCAECISVEAEGAAPIAGA